MKAIVFIILLLTTLSGSASAEIFCKTRYFHKICLPAVPPSYYEGQIIGRHPIAGTGRDAYYETVWSNTYSVKVIFYSGYELNQQINRSYFNENAIVAKVTWENGGYNYIVIKDWFTGLKILTTEEVMYNTEGKRISLMTGYDSEERFWEFYF